MGLDRYPNSVRPRPSEARALSRLARDPDSVQQLDRNPPAGRQLPSIGIGSGLMAGLRTPLPRILQAAVRAEPARAAAPRAQRPALGSDWIVQAFV